ncbi:MAG: prepilin-type N-terminal cleavage/methylation domain-containing protein [Pseudomonadota bacterium]
MTANHAAGFTLLEVLVVMVMISILVTVAGLSLGGASTQSELDQRAVNLRRAMQNAQFFASSLNRPMGLDLYPDGYEYVEYLNGQWLALDREWAPAAAAFPDGIEIVMPLTGELDFDGSAPPELAFTPSAAHINPIVRLVDHNHSEALDIVETGPHEIAIIVADDEQ